MTWLQRSVFLPRLRMNVGLGFNDAMAKGLLADAMVSEQDHVVDLRCETATAQSGK